jgi:hypothetical protein
LLVLKKSISQKERLISSSVCATTKTRRYSIDAEACIDLVSHNLATFGDLSLECRGFVKGNGCMVSRRGRNSCDRKIVTIYDDWFSILVTFKFLERKNKVLDKGCRL